MKSFSKKSNGKSIQDKTADYASLFLAKKELQSRQCVYVSQQVHSTISEIVRILSRRDVTVGGYIDNILLHHLEAYREEITNLYGQEKQKIIDRLFK
jgi:hypothetical protein